MTSVPAGSVYKDKSRKGWVAEFRWPERGIRRRWRGTLKREAEAPMEEFRRALGSGLEPTEATFDDVTTAYLTALARTARPASVTFATWALRKACSHIGTVPVADIRASHIESVLHLLEDEGLAPRSIKAVRGQMRAVMQRAVRDRMVPMNPVDDVRGPKVQSKRLDLPAIEKVHALLDSMKEADHPSWPILALIAATGLRTGEARSLRWADVHESSRTITVAGQLDREGRWSAPKTEAGARVVPLTKRASEAVLEARRRQEGYRTSPLYVFAGPDGQPPAPWTAYKAWTRAQEAAWGRVLLTVHGLRHLAISALLAAGLALPDAAKVAGHTDSRILSEVYAHALSDHTERVRRALEASQQG